MVEGTRIANLKANQAIEAELLVLEKSLQTTKNGQEYLALALGDNTGRIQARVWEEASRFDPLFKPGDIVWIRGRVVSYRKQLQLNVVDVKPLGQAEVDPSDFLPQAARPIEDMVKDLREIASTLNPPFKELCFAFLDDADFMALFKRAPAAKSVHHTHVGGLIEHTLSVARLAGAVADHYPFIHRDLLVCGAILHDVGKSKELEFTPAPDYTNAGRLVGHISLGANMIHDRLPNGFPPALADEVLHLILSHHGLLEYGSPKLPQTTEAIALNLVDDLDAKLISVQMALNGTDEDWTDYIRFLERYLYKGSQERPPASQSPKPASPRRKKTDDEPGPGLFE